MGVASSRQGRQQAGLAGKQGRQPGQVEIDDVDVATTLDGADPSCNPQAFSWHMSSEQSRVRPVVVARQALAGACRSYVLAMSVPFLRQQWQVCWPCNSMTRVL